MARLAATVTEETVERLRALAAQYGFIAVSYTHLDVYKRQFTYLGGSASVHVEIVRIRAKLLDRLPFGCENKERGPELAEHPCLPCSVDVRLQVVRGGNHFGWRRITGLVVELFDIVRAVVLGVREVDGLAVRLGVIHRVEPVSYTHLDVYKRQDLYHADREVEQRNPQ